MATGAISRSASAPDDDRSGMSGDRAPSGVLADLREALKPLASLKLTVVLFAMAIFLIFTGTLAQTRHDIGWVLANYFRTGLAKIEFNVFFPPAWFADYPNLVKLRGYFPFPGGFTIGVLMAINLLAAHGVRFKVQSSGKRLVSGLGVIALGCLITWWVVVAGPDKDGSQASAPLEWLTLWKLFLIGLACGCVGVAAMLMQMPGDRKLERTVLGVLGAGLLALLTFLLLKIDPQSLNPSAMRILWQLLKAEIAALVLLAGCVMVFRKRAGIVLLHAGVGLIMANELVVHFLHKEAQMTIPEGQTANYVQDIRTVELAVVDTQSNSNKDLVAVVPQRKLFDSLTGKQLIASDKLPFDVRVVQYFENSHIVEAGPSDKRIADAELGQRYVIHDAPPITGSDSDQKVNMPSAYVALTDKASGKPLGTYLLGVGLEEQPVEVDGKAYEIALRFERNYKDYTMHLYKVRDDKYLGTDIPRNFSSDLQLIDPERGTDRRVGIHMNEPFRYGGETFYQSGFDDGHLDGIRKTTLQVVSNFGWMIPYVACMIVATGLLANFSLTLVRFVRRRDKLDPGLGEAMVASTIARQKQIGQQLRPSPLPRDVGGGAPAIPSETSFVRRCLPGALAFALAGGYLIACAIQPSAKSDTMDLYAFGKLPALASGRVQPVDALARNTLRMLSLKETFLEASGISFKPEAGGKTLTVVEVAVGSPAETAGIKSGDKIEKINGHMLQEYTAEQISEAFDGADNKSAELTLAAGTEAARTVKMKRERQPAVKWLLEVAARPEVARQQRVLRVDSLDLLAEFSLRHRSGYLFSADELSPHAGEFQKLMDGVGKKTGGELTTLDKKAKELDTRAEYYQRLADAFHLVPTPMGNLAMPLPDIFANAVSARFQLNMPSFPTAAELRDDPKLSEAKINAWLQLADQYAGFLLKAQAPMVVPLPEVDNATAGLGQKPDDVWLPYSGAKLFGIRDGKEKSPPVAATVGWKKILDAYSAQNAHDFNQAVAEYAAMIEQQPPSQLATSHPTFEAWFDNWSPFGHCEAIYLLAICLTLISWLAWRGPLNRFAFWLIVFTFVGHTLALGFRMYISGRPPVTNLYSSAIFIGWAAVAAGLALEWIYRLGFGNVLAAVAGFATLLIADRLSLMLGESRGDTIGVMQAVLDTSFWLATHVTSEALGYMATYVAGLLGIIYVIRGVFSASITSSESKDLARMIYGTVCFAMFFSFFGTVLGGLWADDSWGRFWGWDPKENGALIIVLWNALVLHARWDGLVKDRGLSVLAIGGNIVVSWSYFGVNQLGVGLHSYGFTEGVLVALAVFCASQLALIVLGLTPLHLWRSRSGVPATEVA